MPITAEQSYALGTSGGRDKINQQLRADPQYAAFLRSIGVNANGPMQLSQQQRTQAQAWAKQHLGGIGSLVIDPAGNLNNPHGFKQELEQWGPVAAAGVGIAAPFALPALLGAGGGGGAAAAAPSLTAGLSGAAPAITPGAIAAGSTAAGAGTAAAAGGGGMFGLSLPMTNLIAQGAQGVAGSLASSAQGKRAERIAMLEAALRESAMNPFRAANSQAGSLMSMDRAMNTSPTTIQPGGQQGNRYSSLQGGQYQMSPELLQWLTELRQRMATGSGVNPQIGQQNVLPNMNLTRRG